MLLLIAVSTAWASDTVELRVAKQVAARSPGGDARCTAMVWVDERGKPQNVEVRGCSDPYAEAAREAVMRWRWEPPEWNGTGPQPRTTVSVNFSSGPTAPPPPAECRWAVAIGRDGKVTVATEAPQPCAAWFPDRVDALGLPSGGGTCAAAFPGTDRRALDVSGCDAALQPLVRTLVAERSTFSTAERTAVAVTVAP